MTINRMTLVRGWFAAVVITLVVAACGGAGSAEEATTPAAETPAAETVATEATAETATEATATEAPAAEPVTSTEPVTAAQPATATEPVTSSEPVTASEPVSEAAAPVAARTFAIDPAQSEASYFVEEEFFGQAVSFVTAIGTTSEIQGSLDLTIDGSTLAVGDNEFIVDLSTLTSDRPRRDNAIRDRWLESNTYPLATFQANGVTELPADASLGAPVSFKLDGDMTIREITQPLTWDVTATLDGSTLSGTATSFLLMRDFGFEPPDVAGMLRVTDGVSLTVNFVANEVQ